jgi:L-rhamnonate dehydratase
MKITDVEAIVLRQPAIDEGIADGSQDDLLIRVHTDEGITGVGEVDSAPEIARAAVMAGGSHSNSLGLRDVLVGRDPTDVDGAWHAMYRGMIYAGRRGVVLHAMSGVDLALWDIRGKASGVPVSALLGTPRRDRVRAYASRLMPETPAEVADAVGALRARGFTAVKLGWGPLGRDPRHDVRLAEAARAAGGDGMDVLIDAGFGYGGDAGAAIGVARELEGLGVRWLEEPFEPDNFEAYAALADAVALPVAAGEQDTTWWGFRELIERARVDVVQPDVTRCGGLSEAVRIARLARERGVACVPHAWKTGIVKAASLHLNAVLEDAWYQEYCVAETPLNTGLTVERLELDRDGTVAVPRGPGLGVTVDEEVVARFRVG